MLLDFCDSDDTREYCSGMYLNNELCLKHMNQKLNELQYFTYYYPKYIFRVGENVTFILENHFL